MRPRERQREEMLRRQNDVYADRRGPGEKRLLQGMKAKVQRAVKERW
jgi:hypothetical protein